jgi:hypothetical protein
MPRCSFPARTPPTRFLHLVLPLAFAVWSTTPRLSRIPPTSRRLHFRGHRMLRVRLAMFSQRVRALPDSPVAAR